MKLSKRDLFVIAFLQQLFDPSQALRKRQLKPPTVPKHNNATIVLPLHEEDGTVHLHAWFGGKQKFSLIVDTGSHLTALACDSCRQDRCSHGEYTHNYYRETFSTLWSDCDSCQNPRSDCNEEGLCQFTQAYSEGSQWTAVEVTDLLILGTNSSEHLPQLLPYSFLFTLGCQTQLKGLFQTQYADGILGVEPHSESIFQIMAQQGILPRSSFSMCLGPGGDGLMGLGGPLTRYHLNEMQFFEYDTTDKYYYFDVRKVWFGDIELGEETYKEMHEDKPMLDTGTTDIYLPEQAAPVMETVWKDITGKSFENKEQHFTFDEFQKLPNLTYEIHNGVQWTITPLMYMEHSEAERWEGSKRLVLRLNTGIHGTILGWSAMVGYDVYFDYEGGQIGISRCVPPDPRQIECCD